VTQKFPDERNRVETNVCIPVSECGAVAVAIAVDVFKGLQADEARTKLEIPGITSAKQPTAIDETGCASKGSHITN
jgi:hypothetical protein